MTSFLGIEHYAPARILLAGVLAAFGLMGVGVGLMRCVRWRLPPPWFQVVAILVGIQAVSLAVQIAGMAGLASASVLRGIWGVLVGAGLATLITQVLAILRTPLPSPRGVEILPLALACAAMALDLLVAMAPSTKIDELFYHMLVPARVVTDEGLHFYQQWWVAAIWPHMIYQIASAPLHAMGIPDAANVVSWGLSATLIWFTARLILLNGLPLAWAALWVACLCVGMYPVVWHVTGGAHAMGDLAMAAGIVAFCDRERLGRAVGTRSYLAMVSTFMLCAASSKVSLLPVSALVLGFAAWPIVCYRSAGRWREVLALCAPWIIFYCPLAAWAWIESGSPFGPLLGNILGASVYSDAQLADISTSLIQGVEPPREWLLYLAVDYSPLVWVGAIGAVAGRQLAKSTRVALAGLFLLQCALIGWLMPHSGRFLGGIHYGMLIAFASFATPAVADRFSSRRAAAGACILLILPWFAIQAYYATQFFAVSLGREKASFYERHVAFYSDYVRLDRLLPPDAVLLTPDFPTSAVYAPRPMVFDIADIPAGKPLFLFATPETARMMNLEFEGYKSGEVIYENSAAVIESYRTPGRQPMIGVLKVVRLLKN